MTGEWEFKLKQIERGQLSRDTFMHQIRGLTREIVDKVKGFGEKPIEGEFVTLDITCPQCGGGPFKEDYRTYTCAGCGLRVWKSMAAREFEPGEVEQLLTQGRVGRSKASAARWAGHFPPWLNSAPRTNRSSNSRTRNSNSGDDSVDLTTLSPLAPCPVCKSGNVYELDKAYACENNIRSQPGKTCDLRIGKVILQKTITADQMRKLLTEGKTGLIAGFVSKKGKARPFSAFLTLRPKAKSAGSSPPAKQNQSVPPPPKQPDFTARPRIKVVCSIRTVAFPSTSSMPSMPDVLNWPKMATT